MSAVAPGPLYRLIREELVRRLDAGELRPGDRLPSEPRLAREMGVSIGTIRKAIDGLVAEGLLVRQQGRGTFAARHTPELANFRFFRLVDAEGRRVLPEPVEEEVSARPADRREARLLGLEAEAEVVVIERLRAIHGRPAALETIIVPSALMPGLAEDRPLPNALYPHYQDRHGVSVVRAEDRLSATAADEVAARRLGIPRGTPLLMAERLAFDLAGRPVEWRRSLFLTEGLAYRVTLG